MKLLHFLLLVIWQLSSLCPESSALDKIPPHINHEYIAKDHLHIVLSMEHSVDQVFSSIQARRFADSTARTTQMVAELKEHTSASQKDVLAHLSRKSDLGKVKSFWITNSISIERASKRVLQEVLDLHGSTIRDVRTAIMVHAIRDEIEDEYDYYGNLESDKGVGERPLGHGAFKPGNTGGDKPGRPNGGFKPVLPNANLVSPNGDLGLGQQVANGGQGTTPVSWGSPVTPNDDSVLTNYGVGSIGALAAHEAGYDGKGKVIGLIDSGARHTHEILRNNMRPTYNWFDTINGTYYSLPVDDFGHGTHCTGIAAGRRGFGVAPGSEWISCRTFYMESEQPDDVFMECGQWMLCPTLVDGSEPDCSMKPDVVSNSWGGGQNLPWFNDVIAAWHLADITPVFAIGNSGPKCASAVSPGDGRDVIALGATNMNNFVAFFSSRGPTSELIARIKPDFCAPGRKVLSSVNTGDKDYIVYSGTSMACPHMAGSVAVYKQKYPDATYTQILQTFKETAYQGPLGDDACDYKSTNATKKWPNNYCGYGIIRINGALGLPGNLISTSG